MTLKTILLVDDSTTILLSMSSVLTKAGFLVQQASNGAQALTLLQSTSPADLMITDLNMPGMNGIQLIQAARRLNTRRTMPILILSTESQQEKRNEARTAGATGWLVKPVIANDLLTVISKVLPA